MTYQIAKAFSFSASHHLAGLPDGHPCARLHGHKYRVEIVLEADTLDATGFVVDYGALRPAITAITDACDHRHLNEVVDGSPTAEHLARWIFDRTAPLHPELAAVRVSETEGTWAEYRPSPRHR